jgi:tetratricopeptide (TPR) repeat protein
LLLQQGVIQALDDKMPQAEESFLQASRAQRGGPLPSLALGLSQLQTGKLAEAVRSFQAAADIAKDDYRPNYLIALALVRGGGQNQPGHRTEIVSALEKAVRLNPSHADSHVLLGQTYLVNNQLDQALLELEKAIKLQPENATALYQLATAYRKKGQPVQAREFLAKFEALKQREKQEDDLAKKELIQILKVNQAR